MTHSRRMLCRTASRLASLAALACLSVSASVAHADTYTKNTFDNPLLASHRNQGYYKHPDKSAAGADIGVHSKTQDNYISGTDAVTTDIYRDFFSFSLSDLDLNGKTITGVTLRLSTFTISGNGSLTLNNVFTDANTLKNGDYSDAVFNDLGSDKAGNKQYGNFAVTDFANQSNKVVDIALNNNAIADVITKAGVSGFNGYFSLGGQYVPNFTFGNSGFGGTQQLIINYTTTITGTASVPEFGTVLSFGGFLSFGALTWARRRRLR